MAGPLEVDPTISKLIQLIEEQYNVIRELKGRIDGNCTCIKLMLETINGHIIETQIRFGSNDFNSFEAKGDTIANRIDMLETKLMHLSSNT